MIYCMQSASPPSEYDTGTKNILKTPYLHNPNSGNLTYPYLGSLDDGVLGTVEAVAEFRLDPVLLGRCLHLLMHRCGCRPSLGGGLGVGQGQGQ